VRVLFKFRNDLPANEQERVLEDLKRWGAKDIEPLFPEARDDDLASVFVLTDGGDEGSRLLSHLKKDEAVEYAEPEVARKLVSER
jgi:hypothetical protein